MEWRGLVCTCYRRIGRADGESWFCFPDRSYGRWLAVELF